MRRFLNVDRTIPPERDTYLDGKFVKPQLLGPYTLSPLDSMVPQLKLLTQTYVVHRNNFFMPKLGCSHELVSGAILIDLSPQRIAQGGLIKFTGYFVIGVGSVIEEKVRRSIEFPGMILNDAPIIEKYIQFTYRNVRQSGSVNFSERIYGRKPTQRTLKVNNLKLRDPLTKDVECKKITKYKLNINPTGTTISSGEEDSKQKTTQDNAPKFEITPPFSIKEKPLNSIKEQLDSQLAGKKHHAHTSFDTSLLDKVVEKYGTLNSKYLSNTSSPSINSYLGEGTIQVSATEITQIRGALYKVIDIVTDKI